jgi:hypothetical protein
VVQIYITHTSTLPLPHFNPQITFNLRPMHTSKHTHTHSHTHTHTHSLTHTHTHTLTHTHTHTHTHTWKKRRSACAHTHTHTHTHTHAHTHIYLELPSRELVRKVYRELIILNPQNNFVCQVTTDKNKKSIAHSNTCRRRNAGSVQLNIIATDM